MASTSTTTATEVPSQSFNGEDPDHITSSITSSLAVEYQWRNFKIHVTDPEKPGEPVYIVSYSWNGLTFRRTADDEVIGKGINKGVSINSEYEVNGRRCDLRAAKRLATEYTHLSYAFSDSPDKPITMTWKSSCDFKHWDFVCMDEQSQPVARFHSNVWYAKKAGTIEFLGEKGQTPEAQREIVVVGLTLYNQMVIRMNNPFNLLGSLASPKPHRPQQEGDADDQDQLETTERHPGATVS